MLKKKAVVIERKITQKNGVVTMEKISIRKYTGKSFQSRGSQITLHDRL